MMRHFERFRMIYILGSELSTAQLQYWTHAAAATFAFSLLVLLVLGAF
jgi:hypothetical protein